jgi:glyoxylase-like metal-dependent hydrolase (beta-lactamase superfamily II)
LDSLSFKTDMAFAYGEASPMGPGVVRIVARNPSPLTFKGTNTYLVGSTSLAVIDPGPDDDAHREAILKAAGSRAITHIISTHAHRDHVMGWNTTVVAPPEGRMADYIASLEILLDREDEVFLPGHGGRIHGPQRTVKAYLLHRSWREKSVLDAVAKGFTTIRRIGPEIYQGLGPHMIPAATLSVQAHVEYLIEKGLVAADLPLTPDRALSAL